MGKQKGKKALTVRLSEEDHARLLEMTSHTSISINAFVTNTIQAVHELTSDKSPTPSLPPFLVTLKTSMNYKPVDHKIKASL